MGKYARVAVIVILLNSCVFDPTPRDVIKSATGVKLCDSAEIYNSGVDSGSGFDSTRDYFVRVDDKCWGEILNQVSNNCLKVDKKCVFYKNDRNGYIELISENSFKMGSGDIVTNRILYFQSVIS